MKYAFIFPGQGSQAIGMGKDFYEQSPLAKELFDNASDILSIDMKNLLFSPNDELNLTQFTQPAILLVSYIAYRLFSQNCDIKPTFALGHSLGEISANLISGSLSFENAIRLVYERGKLMQKVCEGKDAGMAVVLGLSDEVLNEFCDSREQNVSGKIWCANFNSDGQCVLAGYKVDLMLSEEEIKNLGAKRFLLLPMSVASHCPLLEPMSADFHALAQQYLEDNFACPIIANATLESYSDKATAVNLLTKQLTLPVLYKQSIKKVESEVDCFIEFGYGAVLKGLNKRLSTKPTHSIGSLQSLNATLEELSK